MYPEYSCQSLPLSAEGGKYVRGTGVNNGSFFAIQVVEAVKFTTLTPVNGNFMGTSGGAGDDINVDDEFPVGTYFGNWITVTLASGRAILHNFSA